MVEITLRGRGITAHGETLDDAKRDLCAALGASTLHIEYPMPEPDSSLAIADISGPLRDGVRVTIGRAIIDAIDAGLDVVGRH